MSPCEPVGIVEICERLGVSRSAFDQWQARGGRGQRRRVPFPEPRWTVGGRPAWNWPDIARWYAKTGDARVEGNQGQ